MRRWREEQHGGPGRTAARGAAWELVFQMEKQSAASSPRSGSCAERASPGPGAARRGTRGEHGVHSVRLIPGVANSFQNLSYEGANGREGLGENVIFFIVLFNQIQDTTLTCPAGEPGAGRAAAPSAGPGRETGQYWPVNIQIYLFKKYLRYILALQDTGVTNS